LVDKNVFIIFVQGGQAETKVRKVCESFGANLYPCPNDPRERQLMLDQVESRLDDLDVVLEKSIGRRKTVLLGVAVYLQDWNAQIIKEKAIYHTMNLFNHDVGRQCLVAEGWCPLNDIEKVQDALKRANERSGTLVPSIITVVRSNEQVSHLLLCMRTRVRAC
jgi:V-type H+-transporting ATPase subunit a